MTLSNSKNTLFVIMRIVFLFLCFTFTQSYNGGSEYLQVFKNSNVEIKTLLEEVVLQLKKQNKKAERMLKHLESQKEKIGEAFHHLKNQNDHLGTLLRKMDTQDKHMDRVLQKVKKINSTDYNLESNLYGPTSPTFHFGFIPQRKENGLINGYPGTIVEYGSPKGDSGALNGDDYDLEYGGDYDDDDIDTDSDADDSFGARSKYFDLHAYDKEDKIYDFSDNKKKSHRDFLSFLNSTKNFRLGIDDSKPLVFLPHKLIGALLGTDIQIDCFIEHHAPSTSTYWRFNGTVIPLKNFKYRSSLVKDQEMSTLPMERMTLVILGLDEKDIGTYDCVAEDGGDVDFESVMVYILRNLG